MFDTRKNGNAKREGTQGGKFRRLTCLLLCACMVLSMVPVLHGVLSTDVHAAGATEHIVKDSRVADPNTMDDYLKQLLSTDWGSRYAGRVWTDKSVFAYGSLGTDWDGTQLTLDMTTDGYNGSVGFDADFGHVFSALASSQVVNEYPPTPIDLVIVFDMSASMGQDTRYGIDTGLNMYVEHDTGGDLQGQTWPEVGVPMADRIANSRIQATLNAINQTIDKLMAQNPQNRVAVCGYGANAVVLMPLGHYKKAVVNDVEQPYLTVGGMETLYHPSDLVYRSVDDNLTMGSTKLPIVTKEQEGWYWMNNRDTCYTVVVNAQYNTYTGILDADGDNDEENDAWRDINKTVSNNVLSDDGKPVKAFPGDWGTDGNPTNKHAALSREVYTKTSTGEKGWAAGVQGILDSDGKKDSVGNPTSYFKEAMKPTEGLEADDYVGYFTNTQGGIYLAYKQLADSTATTYTETLTNGVVSTVARIPAAIIMSDGGANFSFNEMGQDDQPYTAEDWNARYGQRLVDRGVLQLDYIKANTWIPERTPNWNANKGYTKDNTRPLTEGRYKDVQHLLGGTIEDNGSVVLQKGDEWYNVFIPGVDTLEGWDGLHGLYNQGADIYEDGTLSTPPVWDQPGVFYSSDNSPVDAPGTILEVLLTAAYMHDVVKTHYNNGWTTDGATEESKSDLFTYTMNVDTEHVPQWGKMRLYPTLDPKEYPLDTIQSAKWYEKTEQFGSENLADGKKLTEVYNDLYKSWVEWKNEGTTKATIADQNNTKVTINSIESAGTNAADYATKLTRKDGKTQEDTIHVTDEGVINNIAYNDDFFDVTSENLGTTFDNILTLIMGKVFVPVSGDNDAGVSNSITYQDPLGEYMEIKNGAINTETHSDAEAGTGPADYDMALLVFGKMHGLVRVGVYDWNWNDKWMSTHDAAEQGIKSFPMGWYHGSDPATAEKAKNTKSDGSGSYPFQNNDGSKTYANANAARADGWVFRLNYATLLQFVPITGVDATDPDLHPSNLPAQVKNTVYTCYRFAGTPQERNALHMNPIFGTDDDIPEKIRDQWATYAEKGNYPDNDDLYAGTPGVYRLSDIRVWTEDTGDFVDTDGAIAPNGGYDRSLYLNVPAAVVPTQLATITLGKDGVLSYLTNLATDKGIDYEAIKNKPETKRTDVEKKRMQQYEALSAQSTPLRLFYAVGLEENLILRDDDGNQIGVDFTKISPEYIQAHTVEGQDYVWFISNYYSNTTYDEYVTDTVTSRTRGDPTVTFSPNRDNRYYVFQKPLPLYAHAYRNTVDGLKAVDRSDGVFWSEADNQKGGNGSKTWETVGGVQQQPGSWVGGEYMGTYTNEKAFQEAVEKMKDSDGTYITDDNGIQYLYQDGGIVFLEQDLMDHVTSKADGSGYADGSVSFNSNDYFFLLVEYYLPDETVGKDINGEEIPGATGGRMVQRAVARRGSEFGSGFASDNIDNGDMLCWTDINGKITLELDYLSKSDTGDLTRGEPTFEKLTYTGEDLRTYLTKCGIEKEDVLNQQVEYWTNVQKDENVRAALNAAKKPGAATLSEDDFNEAFQFAVSARPGGIRSGDMSNNRHAKSDNKTQTAQNYYVPTVSDNSATDDGVILNTYLGNNGRLEIANQMLHVTKLLEAPEGFELTKKAENETFNYQIFVQGVTGTRSAIKTQYNEFSGTWDRQLAYIDVLTDNSDLVVDNDSNRALFLPTTVEGTLPEGAQTAKQVIENEGVYYFADENGNVTDEKAQVGENDATLENLYYLYLPPNGSGENAQHTRRLYQNPGYTDSAYNADDFLKNGTTTYENDDTKRPAGTITYWAQDAELIPVTEVQAAETVVGDSAGEFAAYAETVSGGQWVHTHEEDAGTNHIALEFFTLVIRKPSDETSMTAFESPFKTRSAYMTVDLVFGKNANPNDGSGEPTGIMTTDDVYDQIIPSADRPDLFGNISLADIASHTAEFTLKHGEGLLLSGLDNRIAYRFTEKLTEAQLKKGYTLKRISHIQQRGSESIYLPGVQKIPIYSYDNATYGSKYDGFTKFKTENGLTWAKDANGALNSETYIHYEPFAHTNATMWEYYATMEENSSGNHHQPIDAPKEKETFQYWANSPNQYKSSGFTRTVTDNPSCTPLAEGGCDVVQDDGTTLHYMYYNGQLVDPHYNGEASSYMRNMARYGVSPTVHFGVNGEKDMGEALTSVPSKILQNQKSKDTEYYDYNGVYSVYGNTGWFEEQANFVNTISPEMLVVTKEVVDKDGGYVAPTSGMVFSYTLELTATGKTTEGTDVIPDLTGYDTIYLWKGSKKDMTSALKWVDDTDKDHPKEYTMPASAPNLDAYQKYIFPTDGTAAEGGTYLQPLKLTESTDGKLTCTFDLKADEAAVFYGIPAGTNYTVTEAENPNYPISQTHKEGDPYSKVGSYEQTGEVLHDCAERLDKSKAVNRVAMRPSQTDNRRNYYNEMSTGDLTVEKKITDDDAWEVGKTFTFTVTLKAEGEQPLKSGDLTVTKFTKTKDEVESSETLTDVDWEESKDGDIVTGLTAEFTLQHGQRFVISGIPLGTGYTVAETGRDGYHLEYVVDLNETSDTGDTSKYQHPADFGVSGTVDKTTPQVYWLFANAKPVSLPFSGGFGVGMFYVCGAVVLLAAAAVFAGRRRKRGKRVI